MIKVIELPLTLPTSITTHQYLFFHSSLKHWKELSLTNCPPISHKTICLTLIYHASEIVCNKCSPFDHFVLSLDIPSEKTFEHKYKLQ